MSLKPTAILALAARVGRLDRPRRSAATLVIALALPLLTQCEAWDDTPPATAANAAPRPVDPNAPLPPGPPIPPQTAPVGADGSNAAGAADVATDGSQAAAPNGDLRYASDEYAIGADTDSYADNDPAALTDFRAPLEPYGTWADDPTYGTVWTPSASAVGADFTPYESAGHWAYDDDYVWVSDYSWGWAPFHYGRWVFADGRGWMWIPGREYRGAWVSWSVDDGYSYLGWAPMGPSFVWFGGVPVGYRGYWGPRWAYVPRGEVFAPRVAARVVVGPSALAIGGRMRPYSVTEGRLGPPPQRFGYTADRVPRVTGAAAVNVAHAQQFARPSTARPLGASAPTRFESRPAVSAAQSRGPLVQGARPAFSNANPPRGASPTSSPTMSNAPVSNAPRSYAPRSMGPAPANVQNAPRPQATPSPAARAPAMPAVRTPGPSFGGARPSGGGGHHR